MKKFKPEILIDDWAGNVLFQGPYNSPEVDKVLDANRCTDCEGNTGIELDDCETCDASGYWGDFEVSWTDEDMIAKEENVYEWINY